MVFLFYMIKLTQSILALTFIGLSAHAADVVYNFGGYTISNDFDTGGGDLIITWNLVSGPAIHGNSFTQTLSVGGWKDASGASTDLIYWSRNSFFAGPTTDWYLTKTEDIVGMAAGTYSGFNFDWNLSDAPGSASGYDLVDYTLFGSASGGNITNSANGDVMFHDNADWNTGVVVPENDAYENLSGFSYGQANVDIVITDGNGDGVFTSNSLTGGGGGSVFGVGFATFRDAGETSVLQAQISYEIAPEPSAGLLAVIALGFLGCRRRR